ncbi:MAG: polysaccharide biosynthesis tyrosine autokinase [Tissierellia bacterium]|nr:polysaccharide biosynthesis tyrosine autokinase [Tissierellia bacterium]
MYEEEFNDIDLREIFQIIRKYLALIIIIPIVFAAAGAVVSIYLIQPVYESSTTLIVREDKDAEEKISISDVNLSKSLVYTYAEMAKSHTVLDNTAKTLKIDKLDDKSITVSPVKDTQIIKVAVQNTDPVLARDIADALVEEFTLEIQRITKTNNVAVVDYARLPLAPVKPDIIMNTAIAGILGAMVILLIVFLKEYFDSTAKTEKDIENLLGLSIIGAVPNFNHGSKTAYGNFLIKDNPSSPTAEAYRKITTNIEFSNVDNVIKTIMITSAKQEEGKTTTICNLAMVMTELKKNILLIDLDLRKPTVHKQFKLSNKIGLTDLLMKKDDYKAYLQNIYPGLDVLTTGMIPANPAEIINSRALKELIKEVSADYDYILLDAPPVMLVSDPIIISTFSNAVILAIEHGKTEKELAKKAVNSLKQVDANIIGAVFNNIPVSKQNNYYYYKSYC